MTYEECLRRLRGYEQQAEKDAKSGLGYMAEYLEMCITLAAGEYGISEDEIRHDMSQKS